ncbi:hypothetical protein RB595_008130 [Gaeumannomyces hyphopodioides]
MVPQAPGSPTMPHSPAIPELETVPKRRRPLVTYGKRKPAPRETTPPPKKRRLESPAERDPSPIDEKSIVAPTSPTPTPPLTSPPKSSILRYFKKVTSPTSASEQSFTAVSASQTPDSTPLASPLRIATPESRPRSRRRLTTRPFAGPDAVSLDDNERRTDHAPGTTQHATDPPRESPPHSIASDNNAPGDASANTTNSACNCGDKLCRHTRRARSKRAGHKSPAATVQMTLNLSTRDASIKQCRECDMLYNPLHPSDVKHHARHHASVVKMKAAAG